jgi:FlaA1/EpsC-like NDP-sugar epimerase
VGLAWAGRHSGECLTNDKGTKPDALGRSWLISGVCGTIGRKLLERVLELAPRQVVGIDNNESELFYLYDEHKNNPTVKLFTADLRDGPELGSRMAGCEMVLHAAAVKHVLLCEESPFAAIHVNILGTQNIIDAAMRTGVERLLLMSSDKAVNPTNVMGTSKLMAERLVSAASARTRPGQQVFASTRFGNVLGSRGSVIPLFMRQIRAGGPVTLTDPDMTRFIMTLDEAIRLVLDSLFLARGGEIFVTKMPVLRVGDLAEIMIELLAAKYGYRPADIRIEHIGPRAGEKMYEELMNDEEIRRSIELPRYFVIRPAVLPSFRDIDYSYPDMSRDGSPTNPYNSKNAGAMSKAELTTYLQERPALLQGG